MHMFEAAINHLHWPRSLFGRLILVLCSGMLAAHALAFALSVWENQHSRQQMMADYVTRDIRSSLRILETLPAEQRAAWLDALARAHYRYSLHAAPAAAQPVIDSEQVSSLSILRDQLPARYALRSLRYEQQGRTYWLAQVKLQDGMPLTIAFELPAWTWPWNVMLMLLGQLCILALSSWFAVRLALKPLQRFVAAVANFDKQHVSNLPASAPTELYHTAVAFCDLRTKIRTFLRERMQILAAITHDLQTPMTRLRLRTELLDANDQRDKMLADLDAMDNLIRQGLAYAQLQNPAPEHIEATCKIDLDAFMRSLHHDYLDSGQQLVLHAQPGLMLMSKPQALRRLLSNLLDNALKFAQEVELCATYTSHHLLISVRDRGPGIPQDQLEMVFQPYYRLEHSRNRSSGGAGLGLAIARQLAQLLGAQLSLQPRAGGGLLAELSLPCESKISPTVPTDKVIQPV